MMEIAVEETLNLKTRTTNLFQKNQMKNKKTKQNSEKMEEKLNFWNNNLMKIADLMLRFTKNWIWNNS